MTNTFSVCHTGKNGTSERVIGRCTFIIRVFAGKAYAEDGQAERAFVIYLGTEISVV